MTIEYKILIPTTEEVWFSRLKNKMSTTSTKEYTAYEMPQKEESEPGQESEGEAKDFRAENELAGEKCRHCICKSQCQRQTLWFQLVCCVWDIELMPIGMVPSGSCDI